MRSSVLCILAISHVLMLSAQDFRFAHYPFNPDLWEIRGHTLHITDNHMLYVGTDAGLFAFDGTRFRLVRLPLDSGAHAYSVTAIASNNNTLWIGTETGEVLYGSRTFTVIPAQHNVPVRALSVVDSMPIAATYGKGLWAVHDSGKFVPELPSEDLYDMTEDEGEIWVASDAGIMKIQVTGLTQIAQFNAGNGLLDEINISLTRTEDGLIWAGSFERGFCYIDDQGRITYPLPEWHFGPVLCMTGIGRNEIWISTEQHGVFLYRRSNHTLVHVDLPGNATPVIVSMETDREGNVWLLDAYRGLYRSNRRFEEYPSPLEGIQSLMFDHAGTLYAGNADGLYILHLADSIAPQLILDHVNVVSLFEDQRHNLWIGTFGQGLWCRPKGQGQWHQYRRENGLTDESILSITGMADTLWLATLGGVTRLRIESQPDPYRLQTTNYNLADGLGTNFIYTAFADSKGRIWFGTDGKGLSMLDGEKIMNFQQVDSVVLHSVYSITEDIRGRIWFVTDRDGVFYYDGQVFTPVQMPDPYRDLAISNMVADPYGNVLLAHTTGIDLIAPDGNMILYRSGSTELLNPNLNAHFRDSSGAIWIAGQNAILKYHPLASIDRNEPYNILSDVSVFLTPVDFRQENVFAANQNYLTFHYIGLWYTNPESVIYRYRMEGLDPAWKQTSENSVTYQNIPPGTYTFVLESSASGRFLSHNAISYRFTIRRPYYQQAWFILMAGLLCISAIYFALRIRDRRISKTAALERRQIESQLQTLKAQINPHFLFNSFNTLVSVIEEDPDAAVSYVENLSDFYRSILQYREKNLIPLREEIEIVRTYAHLLEKRYGSALILELPDALPEVWIVPLVLQMLVENAVKHNVISERRPLTIRIGLHGEQALIVENSLQKKPIAGASTGFGLENIVSRYALLTRRAVQVGQTEKTFYVIVPVLNRHEISDY